MNASSSSSSHRLTQRHLKSESVRPRILIVDDTHDSATALAAYLDAEMFECRIARSGEDAIFFATDWLPLLILMDISMPAMNGAEAALALRNNEATRDIAIIAYTALAEHDVMLLVKDHEFDGYCQKGTATTHLLPLIWQLISIDRNSEEQ